VKFIQQTYSYNNLLGDLSYYFLNTCIIKVYTKSAFAEFLTFQNSERNTLNK